MVLLPVPDEYMVTVEEAFEVMEAGGDVSAKRVRFVPVTEFTKTPVGSGEFIAILEALLRQDPKFSSHPSPQ